MALYWPRRHRLLACDLGRSLRQAVKDSHVIVAFRLEGQGEAVTTWVKPRLVAEVKFTEWTSAGEMRHPVFLGLREDKRAEEVVLETTKAGRARQR